MAKLRIDFGKLDNRGNFIYTGQNSIKGNYTLTEARKKAYNYLNKHKYDWKSHDLYIVIFNADQQAIVGAMWIAMNESRSIGYTDRKSGTNYRVLSSGKLGGKFRCPTNSNWPTRIPLH